MYMYYNVRYDYRMKDATSRFYCGEDRSHDENATPTTVAVFLWEFTIKISQAKSLSLGVKEPLL